METTVHLLPINARCCIQPQGVTGRIVAQAQHPHPELWIVQLDSREVTWPYGDKDHTFTITNLVVDASNITLL